MAPPPGGTGAGAGATTVGGAGATVTLGGATGGGAGAAGFTVVVTTGGGEVVVTTGGATVVVTGAAVVRLAVIGAVVVDVATVELVTEVLVGLGGLVALLIKPMISSTAKMPPVMNGHFFRFFGVCCGGIGPHCGPGGGPCCVIAFPSVVQSIMHHGIRNE